MRRASLIAGTLIVFLVALALAELVIHLVLDAANLADAGWVRMVVGPAIAALAACAWVWFTSGRRG
jgi:hypothetical protein